MGLLRKISVLFGLGGKEENTHKDEEEDDVDRQQQDQEESEQLAGANFQSSGLPRKGFSVPVQVPVERSNPGPILVPCNSGDGGVQGLRWYAKRLRVDEDGDVAHEFLDEVPPSQVSTGSEDNKRQFPKFQIRSGNRPVKVKEQVMALDGRIQHCVEHQGRLQWI